MKASSVTFEEHEIVIIGVKSPIIIRIVLVVLLFAFLLIPIAVIIFRVSSNLGLHFSLVPLAIFLWGIAYFFLKTFLWNSYGKETITLAPHFIEYLPDYKLFEGTKVAIAVEDLKFSFVEKEKDTATFIIQNSSEETIENVLPISDTHTRKLKSKIEDYYRTLE